jgi:hemoglobin
MGDNCDHGGMQTVFEAAAGKDGMRRLDDAWHRRVMTDNVVGHAFSHGFHPQHVERLAAYRAEALGGPTAYSDFYGDETTVVKMHSGNGEHDEMDRSAASNFDGSAKIQAERITSGCRSARNYPSSLD